MESYLALASFLACLILPIVDSKLPDLATMCPYNDFCTTKALKTLSPNETNLMPCCQKCSCEPDCQLFGNCCPDKELTPGVVTKYPCTSVDKYYNRGRQRIGFTKFNIYYHVINDCPSFAHSIAQPACNIFNHLEDFVFVSDPVTGRVYQNKHCATCNGVKHYTEWLLVTDCPEKSEGLTREEWFTYVLKFCGITSIPPDSTSGQAFRCFPSYNSNGILKCNHTGTWKKTDEEILNACELVNTQINNKFLQMEITRGWTATRMYENAYCKLCNADEGAVWPDLCVNMLSPFNGKSVVSFSVIINFRKDNEISLVTRCKQGQIWDPFQHTCMAVICPGSLLLISGRCEGMYEGLAAASNAVYGVFFHIGLASNRPTLTVSMVEFLNITNSVATRMINNGHCSHCESYIYADKSQKNKYLQYIVRTRDGCPKDFLFRQVIFLLNNPHEFYDTRLRSNITLVPDLTVSPYMLAPEEGPLGGKRCPPEIHVSWRNVDPCPRISLTYAQINTTAKTERNNTICVNEYFKIMQAMNGADIFRMADWTKAAVMIVIYIQSYR